MAMTDAPTVRIAGITLANRWDVTRRIALAGLAITWGRSSHLDRAKPAQLKLEVLDTDGHLASATHLTGKPVEVFRADGRAIFRGRVDDYEFDHVYVSDPSNSFGIRRRVWRLMLTAADKLAELAQAVFPGPGNEAAGKQHFGPNYWFIQRPAQRLADLTSQGAGGVVSGIAWVDPYAPGDMAPLVRYRAHSDGLTALDHIEAVYNAIPLAHPIYVPASNRIEIGQPARSDGIRLTWDGDTLRLAMRGTGAIVPAHDIAVPNGFRASTGMDEAIDVVAIASPQVRDAAGLDTVDAVTQWGTARYNQNGTGRREHRVRNDIFYSWMEEAPPVLAFSWPFPLANVTGEFGEPRDNGRIHEGIDFAGGPVVGGADIPAIGAGTVVVSEFHTSGGWGNYVIVDHGDVGGVNLKSLYAHMPNLGIGVGTQVQVGDTVGQVGDTGNSYGNHLHMETWLDNSAIDPRDFMEMFGGAGTPGGPIQVDVGLWQSQLARDTAALLDQINGKVNLPTIRFDWRYFDYGAYVTDVLLDTYDKAFPLYFPGSVFNVVIDAATVHQVIGGTLVYYQGWSLDATLAPAAGHGDSVTIADLVRADAPRIDDFDPDLTIADLGNVTQGVPA